mmetsp:Transcript_10999/g.25889  ORF Transcript_10999/g.25889 Transcript_10999/m.25889 type:complete len:336 (+) Transcript_10999:404-1411(+)
MRRISQQCHPPIHIREGLVLPVEKSRARNIVDRRVRHDGAHDLRRPVQELAHLLLLLVSRQGHAAAPRQIVGCVRCGRILLLQDVHPGVDTLGDLAGEEDPRPRARPHHRQRHVPVLHAVLLRQLRQLGVQRAPLLHRRLPPPRHLAAVVEPVAVGDVAVLVLADRRVDAVAREQGASPDGRAIAEPDLDVVGMVLVGGDGDAAVQNGGLDVAVLLGRGRGHVSDLPVAVGQPELLEQRQLQIGSVGEPEAPGVGDLELQILQAVGFERLAGGVEHVHVRTGAWPDRGPRGSAAVRSRGGPPRTGPCRCRSRRWSKGGPTRPGRTGRRGRPRAGG